MALLNLTWIAGTYPCNLKVFQMDNGFISACVMKVGMLPKPWFLHSRLINTTQWTLISIVGFVRCLNSTGMLVNCGRIDIGDWLHSVCDGDVEDCKLGTDQRAGTIALSDTTSWDRSFTRPFNSCIAVYLVKWGGNGDNKKALQACLTEVSWIKLGIGQYIT